MRRKRAYILMLTICLLLVICEIGFPMYQAWKKEVQSVSKSFAYSESHCGINLTNIQAIESQMIEDNALNISLTMDSVRLPYLQTEKCWFLSQNLLNENWDGYLEAWGKYDNSEYEIYGDISDSYWSNKPKAIAEGHIFSLWIIADGKYTRTNIQFTGVPIIEMTTTEEIPPEPITYEEDPDKYFYDSDIEYLGEFRIWEANVPYTIVEAAVSYHEKGAAARAYPKKSYSIKLMDRQGNDASVSLLGMRESSSWKLNALYGDPNKIREKTTADLWAQLVETSGHSYERGSEMEYVELVQDGSYQGIYCLVEPVNETMLALQTGDYLYKSIDSVVPNDTSIQESIEKKWRIQSPIRIRYPKNITDYSAAWEPIRAYFNTFYRNESFPYEKKVAMVEPDNLIDMSIFLMVVSGSDNTLRNIYFVATKQKDGTHKIIQIPWDFDLTFGRIPIAGYTGDITAVYMESALPALKYENEELNSKIYATWEDYRQGIFSLNNITGIMQANMDYLISSGAFSRECTRWPDAHNSTDLTYLYNFQTERMTWLDRFFDEWTANR